MQEYIPHGFRQEGPRPTGAIKNDGILVALTEVIHKISDMLRGKYLAILRLLLIPVELIEENGHHVFPAPFAGIDAVRNLDDPTGKALQNIFDSGLFFGVFRIYVEVHPNIAEHFKQLVQLCVLVLCSNERLVERSLYFTLKSCPAKVGRTVQIGSISPSHQCTSRENHPVIKIFDAEFRVKAVVDSLRQVINMVFINSPCIENAATDIFSVTAF